MAELAAIMRYLGHNPTGMELNDIMTGCGGMYLFERSKEKRMAFTYIRSLLINRVHSHIHFIHTSFTLHSYSLHLPFTFIHTSFTLHSHFIHTSFTLHSHFIHTSFTLHSHSLHTPFTFIHTPTSPTNPPSYLHIVNVNAINFRGRLCYTRCICGIHGQKSD